MGVLTLSGRGGELSPVHGLGPTDTQTHRGQRDSVVGSAVTVSAS